jgi:hypothetical protein
MKARRLVVFGAAIVFGLSLIALTVDAGAAPRPSKTVTIDCAPGWRAGAGGSFGGVPFNVTCKNGRFSTRLDNPNGSAYSIRMGVESDAVAADCAFSGDSPFVARTCADVRLTIH